MTRGEFDEAITEVFLVLWPRLFHYLLRNGCNAADANDIVQITYAQLVHNKKYDGFKKLHGGSLFGFFRNSVRFTYLNFLREQIKLQEVHEVCDFYEIGTDEEPSKAETLFKDTWTPLRSFESKQVQAAMHRALDKLPVSLQEAIERHFAERVSVRVLAAELGVKEKTMASRLIRSKKYLQKALKGYAVG